MTKVNKEEIIKLLKEGKTYKEISSIFGITKATISYHAKVAGLEKYHYKTLDDYDWKEVQKYYDKTNHSKKTKKKFRMSASTWKLAQDKGKISSKTIQFYDDYIKEWKRGLNSGSCNQGGLGEYTSEHVKRYIREKYNHQCARCGWCEVNKVTGLVPCQVEHIDGNATNNREENLILLCPNCHSLTPTFGALNKGKGRKSRYNAHIGK